MWQPTKLSPGGKSKSKTQIKLSDMVKAGATIPPKLNALTHRSMVHLEDSTAFNIAGKIIHKKQLGKDTDRMKTDATQLLHVFSEKDASYTPADRAGMERVPGAASRGLLGEEFPSTVRNDDLKPSAATHKQALPQGGSTMPPSTGVVMSQEEATPSGLQPRGSQHFKLHHIAQHAGLTSSFEGSNQNADLVHKSKLLPALATQQYSLLQSR